jgi:cytochrome P450
MRGWVSLVGAPTVLVVDPYGIQRVLEHSPTVYADPPTKHKGMAHFQPDAVTISRPPLWELRRRFNVEVLATGRMHPFAEQFLRVIQEEVKTLLARSSARIVWADLEQLFKRITLRIVFGSQAVEDAALVESLDQLMFQANRLLLLKRNYPFEMLYQQIEKYLSQSEPNTLAALCRDVMQKMQDPKKPIAEQAHMASQIPHWLFAMKDTLAINTGYCLVLLADHSAATEKARAEIRGLDGSASQLFVAAYLEGCVQEAMRLWPTTPMLARECAVADLLGEDVLQPGTQVLVWNSANHRNPEAYPDLNQFRPERWSEPGFGAWFNHLSNGPQGCAGKELALFIAKAVVAELLRDHSYQNRERVAEPDGSVPGSCNPFQIDLERMPLPPAKSSS